MTEGKSSIGRTGNVARKVLACVLSLALALVAIVVPAPQSSQASEQYPGGTFGGVHWGIDASGTLDICGIGGSSKNDSKLKSPDVNVNSLEAFWPWLRYRDQIKGVTVQDCEAGSSIRGMFAGCKSLEWANLDTFITSDTEDFSSLFEGDTSLTYLYTGLMESANAVTMKDMFLDCPLEEVKFCSPQWDFKDSGFSELPVPEGYTNSWICEDNGKAVPWVHSSSSEFVRAWGDANSSDAKQMSDHAWFRARNFSRAIVSVSNTDLTYDGEEQFPAIEKITLDGKVLYPTDGSATTDIRVNRDDSVSAGTYRMFIQDSAFGTVRAPEGDAAIVEYTIKPKAAIVRADPQTKARGSKDPELTATVSGVIGGDELSYSLSRDAGERCGSYAIRATGASNQGSYTVSFVDSKLDITLDTQDQKRVDKVGAAIDALGGAGDGSDVRREDTDAVNAARTAYDALDDEEKALVSDARVAKLENAEKRIAQLEEKYGAYVSADKAISTIDQIGQAPFTRDDGTADPAELEQYSERVRAARAAYDALDENQKKRVSFAILDDLEKGERAVEHLNGVAVDKVHNLIDSLYTNDAAAYRQRQGIKSARDAYEALTDEQKSLVSSDDLAHLQKAEAAAKAYSDSIPDRDAAKKVQDLISGLPCGVQSESDYKSVGEVSAAYDALTPAQRAYVSDDAKQRLEQAQTLRKEYAQVSIAVYENGNGDHFKVDLGTRFKDLKLGTPKTSKYYKFLGWYMGTASKAGDKKYTDSYAFTRVHGKYYIYARFEMKHPQKVTFKAHGGWFVDGSKNVVIPRGAKLGSKLASVYRGHTWDFTGWYTKERGGQRIRKSTVVKKNMTVHAHWKPVWYRVKFKPGKGHITRGVTSRKIRAGKRLGTLPKVSRKGYRFLGWHLHAPYDKGLESVRAHKGDYVFSSGTYRDIWVKRGSGKTVSQTEWNRFLSIRKYELTYADVKAIFGGKGANVGTLNGYPAYRWMGKAKYGYTLGNSVTLGFSKRGNGGICKTGSTTPQFRW